MKAETQNVSNQPPKIQTLIPFDNAFFFLFCLLYSITINNCWGVGGLSCSLLIILSLVLEIMDFWKMGCYRFQSSYSVKIRL